MSERTFCAICDEIISRPEVAKPWNRSPWGDGEDLAHPECADSWEPSDEQLEARAVSAYPTLAERQDAARRLK